MQSIPSLLYHMSVELGKLTLSPIEQRAPQVGFPKGFCSPSNLSLNLTLT